MPPILFLIPILLQFSGIISNAQYESTSTQETEYREQLKNHLNNDYKTSELASVIDLIEKGTAYKYKHYYPIIDSLYSKALLNTDIKSDYYLLTDEVERISLIAEKEVLRHLKNLLKNEITALGKEIALFWNRQNPNPFSTYNIRLFEHWERINYAKENFTKRFNTILETDDRGLVYVKYGSPSKHSSGILTFNSQRVRSWMREYDIINSHWSDNQELNNTFLANLVSQYYHTPFYDIWVYEEITDKNLIFIFGNNGDTGQFEMVHSLEELIPSNSFRARNELKRFNTGPSLFLQLMMYDHLSIFDQFFSSAFQELESQLLSRVNVLSPEYSRSRMQNHRSIINTVQNQAPKQNSAYLTNIHELDLEHKYYLTFDNKGEPIYYSFIYIEDQNDVINNEQYYPIRFCVFDQQDLSIEVAYDSLFTNLTDENIILSFKDIGSSLLTVNSYSEGHLAYYDFINKQISHNQMATNYKKKNKPGWVGDLIIGKRVNGSRENFNNELVPFHLSSEDKFQTSDILTFYLGIRNPYQGSEHLDYQINIKIEKKGRKFLFIPLGNKTSFTYSLSSNTMLAADEQIVEIDISNLEPASYKLIVSIKDQRTLKMEERSKDFRIE